VRSSHIPTGGSKLLVYKQQRSDPVSEKGPLAEFMP
jgi:hypothetical protein